MIPWTTAPKSALFAHQQSTLEAFESIKAQGLKLDMTRGKPSNAQLDLSQEMLALKDFISDDQIDCRNYGGLDGLMSAKKLFAPMLDCRADQILIGGNASLTLMHDAVWRGMSFGYQGEAPWCKLPRVKFLCPVPGYDRHFGLLQHFGIEMIPVPMEADGPDMSRVEEACANDPSIKGIFCVPKYSNPDGTIYSPTKVKALAKMKAATDFRIFWDNAYAIHHLGEGIDPIAPLIEACEAAGLAERPLVFGSTSKITFAGSGISFLATSKKGLEEVKSHLKFQTIGPNKLNILRHVRFFKNFDHVLAHMDKHAAVLAPKFNAMNNALESEFSNLNILQWSRPRGGYFISINTLPGCAGRTVALAQELGVQLTEAGATYPLGKDPTDTNIRLAPSMPDLSEINQAMPAIAVSIKRAALEALLKGS